MSQPASLGKSLLVLFAAIFTDSIVLASEEDSDVENVVVTASRLDQTTASAPQSVSVLTAEAIEIRQPASVTELLRQFAGVNVIQQGARGGVTSLLLRGGEPNFTVVMIDGVRVNDPTNTRGGSYDFSYLDVNNVERVELVRGPMSAIYGSDALSGVLNILTRESADGGRLRVEVGGDDLVNGSLTWGAESGPLLIRTELHSGEESGAIEGASYEDTGGSTAVRYRFADDGEWGISLRYQDADSTSFSEDSGGPELAVIRELDTRSVQESHVRAFVEHNVSDWRVFVAASRYDREEVFDSPGIAPGVFDGVPPNSADSEYSRSALVASARLDTADVWSLVVGAELQSEDGASTGVLDIGFPVPTDFDFDRDSNSLFAEGEYSFGRVTVFGSVRWDDPDDIDSETSVQLGATLKLPPDAGELRLSAGEGFKAPSFFALAHPIVGNPDLLPETAESLEIGYRRSLNETSGIDVSLFHNKYKNLIDFDPVLFTGVNRSRVVATGVEVSGYVEPSDDLRIDAHLSYLDTDIRDSDSRLRGRPRLRGGVAAALSVDDRWTVSGTLLVLGEFWEVSIPTGGVFLDGYERLDVAVTFDASEELQLALAVDNALDSDYAEGVGFPSAGVRGRLSLAYRF